MDIGSVGIYFTIALITYLVLRSLPAVLLVVLGAISTALAVGLLALVSAHKFYFFGGGNLADLVAGNALAAVVFFGCALAARAVRKK